MRKGRLRRARKGGLDEATRSIIKQIHNAVDLDEIAEILGEDPSDPDSVVARIEDEEDLRAAKRYAIDQAADLVDEDEDIDLPAIEDEPQSSAAQKSASQCCPCCEKILAEIRALSSGTASPQQPEVPVEPTKGPLDDVEKDPRVHAVTVAKKTTVASAKKLAAAAGVKKIPRSGETYILWLTINEHIGIASHVLRLMTHWKAAKSPVSRIKKDCTGGMARQIVAHLTGEDTEDMSETKASGIIYTHVQKD